MNTQRIAQDLAQQAAEPERVHESTRIQKFIVQVFQGHPGDMLIQGIAAMLGALVRVWWKVNPFVGVYVAMVIIDTILGVRLSKRQGTPFKWSRLLYGPGEKIAFTTLILIAAEFMQRYLPGEWLTQSIGAYMSAVLFLEAISKYDKLTGHHILELAREKLSFLSKK